MQISNLEVAKAFVAARAAMGNTVIMDAQANYGKYATLAAVTDVITPALSAHGLALVQEASVSEQGVTVETSLVHESGGIITFAPITMPLVKRDAQAVGSAISYARRYQAMAVCGLAADKDDDDGQSAGQTQKTAPERPQTAKPSTGPTTKPAVAASPSAAAQEQNPYAASDALAGLRAEVDSTGIDVYGADWPQRLAHNAKRISDGQTTTLDGLNKQQLEKLLEGLRKLREQHAAAGVPA